MAAAKQLRHPREGGGLRKASAWMPAYAGMTFMLVFTLLAPLPLLAAENTGAASGIASAIKRTGQPIPRWASLRGEEVNMRAGPGFRYPIAWVFRRKALPVEIIAEFDVWRRIRDVTGAEGWVHLSNLSGKRSFLVKSPSDDKTPQALFRDNRDDASMRAQAEVNVQGTIQRCRDEWCKVEIDGIKGWMKKPSIWGVYDDEKVN